MAMKRILAVAIVAGLILPATAAAHHTVMKPGSRFWVVSSRPTSTPTPNHVHVIGNKFNPYAICRHGIRGRPPIDPAFTTLGGYPLRFTGRGSPPTSSYRFSFSHNRWSTTLFTFHASHQNHRVWQAKAVNSQRSRKVLFFWRCRHPS